MKVIIKDNYNRETVSDTLYKENVSEEEGKEICTLLNINPNGCDYYIVVEDDYKLYDASILY